MDVQYQRSTRQTKAVCLWTPGAHGLLWTPIINLVPRAFSSTIFKMADRPEKTIQDDLLRTIRHFENRRGEGPGDEVAPIIWIMAAMLGDSVVVVVVRMRPRAIPLAKITMRKSTHGFPSLFYTCLSMGLRLVCPLGRRSSAIIPPLRRGFT